jgi:hypothetical protein
MTEWVNQDNPQTPIKNKWTGLVLDPLTSIYDGVIRDIEEEYDKYADVFSSKEGFEYEIDNTPIYAQSQSQSQSLYKMRNQNPSKKSQCQKTKSPN